MSDRLVVWLTCLVVLIVTFCVVRFGGADLSSPSPASETLPPAVYVVEDPVTP